MGATVDNNHIFQRYQRDESGQFAVWFAILAMPIILMLAYVGDMTYAGKVKAELKASLDAAALASVINQNLTESERAAFAKDHFEENFHYSDMFKLDVKDASAQYVELSATGGFPSYLGAMSGRDNMGITSDAASEVTKENIVCMLALAPNTEGSFRVEKGANFVGHDCSVQVNSIHKRASIVDSKSQVSAKSFCVSGGATGQYSPYANTECARVDDPYEFITTPGIAADTECSGKDTPVGLSMANISVSNKWIAVGNNAVLSPGVYCKYVSLEGKNITFLPGIYIFQDNVELFQSGAVSSANEVTFVLNGPASSLYLHNGSFLKMKAPSTGPYAGLAIVQNRDAASIGSKGYSTVSYIKNGSDLDVTGTIYLPTHLIEFSKDSASSVSNQLLPVAPATSFIASQIHITDASLSVAVDHKAAGLPPLLPRSDEGARLVK